MSNPTLTAGELPATLTGVSVQPSWLVKRDQAVQARNGDRVTAVIVHPFTVATLTHLRDPLGELEALAALLIEQANHRFNNRIRHLWRSGKPDRRAQLGYRISRKNHDWRNYQHYPEMQHAPAFARALGHIRDEFGTCRECGAADNAHHDDLAEFYGFEL